MDPRDRARRGSRISRAIVMLASSTHWWSRRLSSPIRVRESHRLTRVRVKKSSSRCIATRDANKLARAARDRGMTGNPFTCMLRAARMI